MPNSLPRSVANTSALNVYTMRSYGKPIYLEDQGVYYTLHQHTGQLHSVFQLAYGDDWYLYQMQKGASEHEVIWRLMAGDTGHSLESMTSEEINHHFSRPEFAEPRGAWQVMRNANVGFAKFTPVNASSPLKFALLCFKDGQMQSPVLIHKLEAQLHQTDDSLLSLA